MDPLPSLPPERGPGQPLWGPHKLACCSLLPCTPSHHVAWDLCCCHIQSVTSFPLSTCHSKYFKCRLALGDSDTSQWIQVSTHDQSLKLSHQVTPILSPTISGPGPHAAHIGMSQQLPLVRACRGVGYLHIWHLYKGMWPLPLFNVMQLREVA